MKPQAQRLARLETDWQSIEGSSAGSVALHEEARLHRICADLETRIALRPTKNDPGLPRLLSHVNFRLHVQTTHDKRTAMETIQRDSYY